MKYCKFANNYKYCYIVQLYKLDAHMSIMNPLPKQGIFILIL